jgi:hypothetical protein
MKATATLLFLAHLDPLRTVPIAEIQAIEKTGWHLKIRLVNPDGTRRIESCRASDYVMNQIKQYDLEYSEV